MDALRFHVLFGFCVCSNYIPNTMEGCTNPHIFHAVKVGLLARAIRTGCRARGRQAPTASGGPALPTCQYPDWLGAALRPSRRHLQTLAGLGARKVEAGPPPLL